MSAAAIIKEATRPRRAQKKQKSRGLRIKECKQRQQASPGDGQNLQQVRGMMSSVATNQAVEHEACQWTCEDCMTGEFYPEEDNTVRGISLSDGQHVQSACHEAMEHKAWTEHDCLSGDFYSEEDDVVRSISINPVPHGFDDHALGLCASLQKISVDEKHLAVEQEGCATPVSEDVCVTDKSFEEHDIAAKGISLDISTDSCHGDANTLEAGPFGPDQSSDVNTKETEDLENAVPVTVSEENIQRQVDICQSLPAGGFESSPDRTGDPRTVAIFADYDGCFDILSPSNPSGRKMDKMFDYAEEIGRLIYPRKYAEKLLLDFVKEVTDGFDRVVLFSGSNRQSHKADEFNSFQNDNGLAMTGLKLLAQEHGWEWNANLLEDIGKKPSDIMNTVGGSSKIKQLLAENNFTCLKGPTTVYFFDDVEKYLKYTRDQATVPENIELKTVWFDWYGICIDGIQDGPLIPVSV